MANVFKNAHLADVDTTYVELYATPAATTSVVLGLALVNKTQATVLVDVKFRDQGTGDRMILNQVEIPIGTTLEVLSGQKYILEATDTIEIKCDATNGIDAFMGIMEIS